MSLMSLKLSLGKTGIKELFGAYIKGHGGEIAILAVTVSILAGIAILATGDITSAVVRGRAH